MAKSVVYTCDIETPGTDATGETPGPSHSATLQVLTHSREESTIYTVAVRHTCSDHLGITVLNAYGIRTGDVSNFNRKNADKRGKNTKFADITVTEIPADER